MCQVGEVAPIEPRFRSHTNMPGSEPADSVVFVNTNWPREEFYAEFDRLLRESKYRHESDLAQAAGISHATLSSWRSGRQRPSTKGLAKIAAAFGITSLELWELAGLIEKGTVDRLGVAQSDETAMPVTPRQSPPELHELVDLYNQLDDSGRQAVRTQLQMAIAWARGQLSPE